jgi:hypothetical protein
MTHGFIVIPLLFISFLLLLGFIRSLEAKLEELRAPKGRNQMSEYLELVRQNTELRNERDSLLTCLNAAERELETARRLLWLRHGHTGLYGDDGEMQCGQCVLDFKRQPLDEIEANFKRQALKALAAISEKGVMNCLTAGELLERSLRKRWGEDAKVTAAVGDGLDVSD